MKTNRLPVYAICLALLLQTNLAAAELYKSWNQLTQAQHEALQPLATQWDSLPAKLQKHLLVASNHYPQLDPNQKMLFQSRLETWSKLTPEQREHAREKFLAFSRIKPEIRAQVKQMAKDREASNSPASSVPASTP